MSNCGHACPYNTLDGCKVKEYNAICPLTNIATPITEYRMTNADRIRAMSDEELATFWASQYDNFCQYKPECGEALDKDGLIPDEWCVACALAWLRKPAEEVTGNA